MMLQASSVITVVLLLLCDEVRGEQFDCVRTFTDLEISLISRDSDIDSMSDAFYPPNRQVSIAANVYYFFSDGNEPDKDLDVVSYDYAFRWAASPVFELIRPELLQYASLFVYQGQTTTIKIVLKPICEAMPLQTKLIDEETCIGEANTTKPAQMINKLTTHVRSQILCMSHLAETNLQALTCMLVLLEVHAFNHHNVYHFCFSMVTSCVHTGKEFS